MEGSDFEFSWSWRSLAAIVYLLICLTDFIFMPIYYEYTNNKQTESAQIIALAKQLDGVSQVETVRILREQKKWEPITNEMFHLSFGAILGLSALPTNRAGSGFRLRRRRAQADEGETA